MGISVNFTRTLAVFRRRSQRASGGAQSALSAILAAAAAYDGTGATYHAKRRRPACLPRPAPEKFLTPSVRKRPRH